MKLTFDQNTDFFVTINDTTIEVFFRNSKFAFEKIIDKAEFARKFRHPIKYRGGAEKIFINKVPLRYWSPDINEIIDYIEWSRESSIVGDENFGPLIRSFKNAGLSYT